MKISDIQIAWASGILEGEACFDIRPSNSLIRDPNNKQCRIIVEMKDRDVLEKLQEIFGGSLTEVKCPSKIRDNWSPYYKWLLSEREKVLNCIMRIRPFMSKRRGEKCDEMYEFLERKVIFEN